MAAIYEFHVSGQVGAVVRSALPEMEAFEQRSGRILHGRAAERREIDRLLELIQMFNLIVQRVQICVRSDTGADDAPGHDRSIGGDVPVVDDRGAQRDVLE